MDKEHAGEGGDSHNFREVKYERRKTPRLNAHEIRRPTKACDGHR
jgi:hypothetical protein